MNALATTAALAAGATFGVGLVWLVWRAGLHWSGLITDDATGKVSGTKLCALAGFAAVTTIFVRAGWDTAPGDGLSMFTLVYYGLATGSQFASKLVGSRFGAPATPGTVTERKVEEKVVTTSASTPESAANPSQRSGS